MRSHESALAPTSLAMEAQVQMLSDQQEDPPASGQPSLKYLPGLVHSPRTSRAIYDTLLTPAGRKN